MYQREYGVATEVYVPVPKVNDTDLAATGDYAYVAGDIKLSKDGAATANPGSSPTEIDMGTFMFLKIALSATEMQCKTLLISIADAALEHQTVIIETFGNASARWPTFPADVLEVNGSATAAALMALSTDTGYTDTLPAGTPAGTVDSFKDYVLLPSGAATNDDAYNNWAFFAVAGTGSGQARYVTDYDATGHGTGERYLEVSPPFGTLPDATTEFVLVLLPPGVTLASSLPKANMTAIDGVAVNTATAQIGANVVNVGGTVEDLPTATNLSNLIALMQQGIYANQSTIATVNTQTEFVLTTGAAVDDIYLEMFILIVDQNNVGEAYLTVCSDYVGSTKTLTVDQAAPWTVLAGDSIYVLNFSAEALNDINNGLIPDTAAIKAKTDSLTFTVANQVDANVQSINDVTITGNGGVGTEFGV